MWTAAPSCLTCTMESPASGAASYTGMIWLPDSEKRWRTPASARACASASAPHRAEPPCMGALIVPSPAAAERRCCPSRSHSIPERFQRQRRVAVRERQLLARVIALEVGPELEIGERSEERR